MAVLLHIPGEKLALMTPGILAAEEGHSIWCFGPYAFAEMNIVEIGSAESLG
jgi:hypothetical protein